MSAQDDIAAAERRGAEAQPRYLYQGVWAVLDGSGSVSKTYLRHPGPLNPHDLATGWSIVGLVDSRRLEDAISQRDAALAILAEKPDLEYHGHAKTLAGIISRARAELCGDPPSRRGESTEPLPGNEPGGVARDG